MMKHLLKQAIKRYPKGIKFITDNGSKLSCNGQFKIKDKTIVTYFNELSEVTVYENGVWVQTIHELN